MELQIADVLMVVITILLTVGILQANRIAKCLDTLNIKIDNLLERMVKVETDLNHLQD